VFIDEWVYNVVFVFVVMVCLLKGVVMFDECWIWICFGFGIMVWVVGDIYWIVVLIYVKYVLYLLFVDLGYLFVYLFMYVGVVLFVWW